MESPEAINSYNCVENLENTQPQKRHGQKMTQISSCNMLYGETCNRQKGENAPRKEMVFGLTNPQAKR